MTITNNTKYQFIQAGYIVTEPYFGGILGAGATIDDARGDAIIRLVGIFEEDEIFRAIGSFIYTPATAAAIATFLACDVRANFLIDNGPDGWDSYEKLEAHGCETGGHPLKFFEGCALHYYQNPDYAPASVKPDLTAFMAARFA